MTDSNNSGNNHLPPGQPGEVLSWNGLTNKWITIPVATTNTGSGSGNCAGTWVVPGQTYTITVGGGGCGGGGQISFGDIELAVPVEEKKKNSDGCTCRKCKEFFPYAEPNQDDGTLICYGCRMVW